MRQNTAFRGGNITVVKSKVIDPGSVIYQSFGLGVS